MKLKTLVTAMAVAGFSASTAVAAPSVNAQLNYLQAKVAQLEDQVHTVAGAASSGKALGSSVTFDRDLSHAVLGWQNGSAREFAILDARASGAADSSLFLGGHLVTEANYTNETVTNTTGYFGGRASANTDAVSSVDVPVADLLFMATVNDNTTGVLHLAKSTSDVMTVGQAYVLFGNLKENPTYVTVGNKVPTFGDFSTYARAYAPYTRLAFQPAATGQIALGYKLDNLSFVATAMNGGGSATTNLYTKTANKINNTAFDFKYDNEINGIAWELGVGYLHGSMSKNQTYTVTTGTPAIAGMDGDTVAVWDFNGELSVTNFSIHGEYISTDKKINNKSVYAFDLGAKFDYMWMGRDSDVYVEHSAFHFNDKSNSQTALGVSHMMNDYLNVAVEYAYQKHAIGMDTADEFNTNKVAARVSATF